jgi:DNA (cytosine-5)-methyltransferase 1
MIPVIDLFAGPGGLGEGFSAFRSVRKNRNKFKIVLSIEKDPIAHQTLQLRSFFRQFKDRVPDEYYDLLRGKISLEELYRRFPNEAANAEGEAWLAVLGKPKKTPTSEIDERIKKALDGAKKWVLIGGPPCQAYSLVGRSRMAGNKEKFEKDDRHFLYEEYLRIIAVHRPPVFVMENVKGILSSKVKGKLIIEKILSDLKKPCETDGVDVKGKHSTYDLHAFVHYGDEQAATGSLFAELDSDPSGYVIRAERHGIPQARHRLILLGIRSDFRSSPTLVPISEKMVAMWKVIGDLPAIRSKLSKEEDSPEAWVATIKEVTDIKCLPEEGIEFDVWRVMQKTKKKLKDSLKPGGEFISTDHKPKWHNAWFYDSRIGGICNHSARGHIAADLWRYFFAACFAKSRKKSPVLSDFPRHLLPKHKNARPAEGEEGVDFADRFRVQVKDRPSTTVTAHIAKDGHYFIHPDPVQCRSLTVREAARLQTFPDNYLFLGPRTAQYQQVGNAVPPLLARKLAKVIYGLLK